MPERVTNHHGTTNYSTSKAESLNTASTDMNAIPATTHPHRATLIAVLAILLALVATTSRADCMVHSGPRTAALVELYTSEGCSSCPPADRRLGTLVEALSADAEIVPLALHVSYWDELGWQDIYAQPAFDQRQQWLVQANQQRTVYTPQFFIAGRELRTWHQDLDEAVRAVNARPAAAHINIEAKPAGDSHLALDVVVAEVQTRATAVLYLAITENGLQSSVKRGENGGTTLTHEHVVHTWIGPLALPPAAHTEHRTLPLAKHWQRANLKVTAIVQDLKTGRVLQALRAQHCAAS